MHIYIYIYIYIYMRVSQMKTLNMFYLVIYWTQKVHNDFIFLYNIVLPPVGHSSNHEYNCCQLTRQSSCISNFYRTFKVSSWRSLVSVCVCVCVYIYIYISHINTHTPTHTDTHTHTLTANKMHFVMLKLVVRIFTTTCIGLNHPACTFSIQ